MKNIFIAALSLFLISYQANAKSLFDFSFQDVNAKPIAFSSLKGKTVMLVNIATRCGYTGQLDALEKLYQKYKSKNFMLIGIPSNDFGEQTPENNADVGKFCRLKYGVEFPITEKVDVIGKGKTELFQWINSQKGFEADIAWNFEKFLFDKNGKLVARFLSGKEPLSEEITKEIEKVL